MRVVFQQRGELVVLGVALEPQRAAAVGGFAHQRGRAIGSALDRQAGQQAAVGIELELGQPLGIFGIVAARLGVLALEPMRADHPQKAVGKCQAFQVGFLGCFAGQIQQLRQRKALAFAKAQRLALQRGERAQAVHRTGFIAGHPQPIVGEGSAGKIAVHQRARRKFQADAMRDQGFLGHG